MSNAKKKRKVTMIELDALKDWKVERDPRGRPEGSTSMREDPTVREDRFIHAVMEGKSQTDAVMEAYNYPLEKRPSASTLGSILMKRERVVKKFVEMGYGAATRIEEISKDKKEPGAVRLNANKDILDRAGIGAKQAPTTAVQINFGQEREEYA